MKNSTAKKPIKFTQFNTNFNYLKTKEISTKPIMTYKCNDTYYISCHNRVWETKDREKAIKLVHKIDAEYKTLLKQVEYSTYDECMDIGFEEAIKDPIGILGFSCPYIAYKGEIIGYRLQLDYTNPMEN